MKRVISLISILSLCACVSSYETPDRSEWSRHLSGASMGMMTETWKEAKKPVYQDRGGKLVKSNDARNYMAKLEAELADNLRKAGTTVQRVGPDVLVVMIRDVFMSPDVPDFSEQGKEEFIKLTDLLNKYPGTFIEITGYTDNMGDADYNKSFSFDMAKRVAVFMADHKIDTIRLFIQGRGASRPIGDNATDVGRRMNRRVEIRISPIV